MRKKSTTNSKNYRIFPKNDGDDGQLECEDGVKDFMYNMRVVSEQIKAIA